LPEDLDRQQFSGFQLQVRYHQPTRRVTLRVTIDGESIQRLAATGRAVMAKRGLLAGTPGQHEPPAATAAGGPRVFSLAGRAPGRVQPCTWAKMH
jgi:hypothetical protein